MSEDGLDCLEGPSMEIQIDTLMGTSFDMRVAATDTVREVKQRIQRVEGIPIHQQNLIFQSKELKDSRRLCDAGIKNGSVIKLVIAMKGGPISTRRLSVSCEHHVMLKELKELLENTRDEMGDKLAPGSKVSVLVFKEGDILNLLRVIENEDGSYSPYGEKPISPPSKPTRRESQMAMFEKLVEDTYMMAKISNLRKRMEDVNIKRQTRGNVKCGTQPNETDSASSNNRVSYKFLTNDLLEGVDLKIFEREEEEEEEEESEEVALKDKHRTRALSKSLYGETRGALSHTKQNYARIHRKTKGGGGEGSSKDPDVCVPLKGNTVRLTRLVISSEERPKSAELEESAQDLWEVHEPAGERLNRGATCKFGLLKRRQSLDYGFEVPEKPPKPEVGEYNYGEVCSGNFFHVPQFMAAPSAVPPEYAPKDPDFCEYYFRKEGGAPLYGRRGRSPPAGDRGLPPVVLKKKSRCGECNKRLNITNIYNCRCGKIFCSQHRYSEVHRCSYDYKSEGRRILEHQNPLVTADKVNRI